MIHFTLHLRLERNNRGFQRQILSTLQSHGIEKCIRRRLLYGVIMSVEVVEH